MAGIKTKLQIVLCPHRRHLDADLNSTWLRPQSLPVELVSVTTGEVTSVGVTNGRGVTDLSPELEVGSYRVQLPGHPFEAAELKLIQADNRHTREVTLAPSQGDCLVPLHLIEEPAGTAVRGAKVRVSTSTATREFISLADGSVLATAPEGDVIFHFDSVTTEDSRQLIPADTFVSFGASSSGAVTVATINYRHAIRISVQPTINTPGGLKQLTATRVTVEYRGGAGAASFSETRELDSNQAASGLFEYSAPGVYVVSITPPAATHEGDVIKDASPHITKRMLSPGELLVVNPSFDAAETEDASFVVITPQHQPLTEGFALHIFSPDDKFHIKHWVHPSDSTFTLPLPQGETLSFRIDPETAPKTANIPHRMSELQKTVVGSGGTNKIELHYEHSIKGRAIDAHGNPVRGAMLEVLDKNQTPVSVVVADEQGNFEIGLEKSGVFYISQHPVSGHVARRERCEVNSTVVIDIIVENGAPGGGGAASGEALTDLSAYPVLTEEITTTGPPAPATGAPAGGGPGAGYGQTVDQVMRDVLGWRPSGDVSGFQAALTGAFALRQVEGHTEWSWQQRGYAVQADMGALTGAQASIYARAKSALDQMLPLLAGLTALNPALYPPQDLEAIRSVITAEVKELVNELALEGGPRIQRVDELFRLLTGESRKSLGANPEVVQGQLGILRDRFGLVEAYVDTVDEERIITNFRIVVEQVLTLQESWEYDRKLLSVLDSNTSFGTILIWLSRGLEAVCESVDDLTFALDSVFVDAAQRQVIQLNFSGLHVELPELPLWRAKMHRYRFPDKQAPILLSDLLDWVTRASRDEGPRIVQDAGKDGVLAFAPILDELRRLIYATRKLAHSGGAVAFPDGLRTPRVRRALEVLAAQLDESASLATLVRRDLAPQITSATWTLATNSCTLTGTNFRRHCTVFLFAANREDMPDIRAYHINFPNPTQVTASFRATPKQHDADGWRDWQVMLTNEDGTTSEPVAIQFSS
jgi:hypothetical protein